jgi:hypothetical protein
MQPKQVWALEEKAEPISHHHNAQPEGRLQISDTNFIPTKDPRYNMKIIEPKQQVMSL